MWLFSRRMQISRCEKRSFCFSDQSWFFFPPEFSHCKQTHHPNTVVFGTDVTSISRNNGIDNNGREALSLFLSARSLVWQKRDKKTDLKDIMQQSIVDLSSQADCLIYCLLRRGASICESASYCPTDILKYIQNHLWHSFNLFIRRNPFYP